MKSIMYQYIRLVLFSGENKLMRMRDASFQHRRAHENLLSY